MKTLGVVDLVDEARQLGCHIGKGFAAGQVDLLFQRLSVLITSWLNLTECAFSKMARTFLRHIRVKSIDELWQRILLGIADFNASPAVFRWNEFDLGVA